MKKLIFLMAVCFLYMLTAASIKVIAQPSTDINDYVLFAYDRLSFKGGNQVAGWGIVFGNIGVNNAAASEKTISLEFATSGFAYMADGFFAAGDHVRGDKGGSFYDLYANKLGGNFGTEIRNSGPTPFSTPIIAPGLLPDLGFVPGPPRLTYSATDVIVLTGAVVTFTSPFLQRDVKIKDDAIVTFGPGVFDMRNINIGKNVTIFVDNTTILQIDERFATNNNLKFGLASSAGAKIYVGSYGLNWTTTTTTNFSHYSEVHANYFAPNGWLDIGGKNNLYGHFWARSISGDANDNVYGPPPTFPHNPCEPLPSGVISTNINDYVLFAYNELIFKGGNLAKGFGYIFGNIGVNYSAAVANPHSNFSLDYATSKGAWIADGYIAVADKVRGDASGSFWDLFANTLNASFASTIRDPLEGAIPPIPPAFNFTPPIIATIALPDLGFDPGNPLRGTDIAPDLTIANGATVNFSPPFLYHNVRINDDAVVNFSAGVFDMWNLSIGKDVTIIVDDGTILQIDVKFDPNDRLSFGVGSNAGAKIYVGHYGLPTTVLASNFSHGAVIHANYFSPTGDLDIGGGNNLYGRFWALRITGDPNNNVFCEIPVQGDAPISSVNPGVKGEGIQMSIFPNPAKEAFTLQINNSINQGSILTLQDLTGKVVLHTALQLQEGVNNYPVSIAGISQGVYIVKLQTGTGVGQTKLIINR